MSWQLNRKFNCSSQYGVCGVPQSCCINQSNMTCGFGVWQNRTLKSSNIYKDNCLQVGSIEECFYGGATTTLYAYFFLLSDLVYLMLAFCYLFKHRTMPWTDTCAYYMGRVFRILGRGCCIICTSCPTTCKTVDQDEGNVQLTSWEDRQLTSLDKRQSTIWAESRTGSQTFLLDNDSTESDIDTEEHNSGISCVIRGWRLLCGRCQFRQRQRQRQRFGPLVYCIYVKLVFVTE